MPSASYPTIQSAINASVTGDAIIVAASTYHESLSWVSKDLIIQGAGIDVSIIDPATYYGGPGGRCLLTNSLTANSRIDGFTFQHGGIGTDVSGAGMYNYGSNLNMTRCAFRSNTSSYGGGMCNDFYSNPRVDSCIFNDNVSYYSGGGMVNNAASNPIVTNCIFDNNKGAHGGGGGMYNWASGPTVINCLFCNNTAIEGGGMSNVGCSPIVRS